MEDWTKHLFDFFDTVTLEVEQFFDEVNETVTTEVERFWDDVDEIVDWIAEEVEQSVSPDLEDFFEDLEVLFDRAIVVYYAELEEFIDDGEMMPFEQFVEPSVTQNPACQGCQHYHGHVYGGNLLICGMHPYGWDGETCPDWEG
jgi:hypothetical protein